MFIGLFFLYLFCVVYFVQPLLSMGKFLKYAVRTLLGIAGALVVLLLVLQLLLTPRIIQKTVEKYYPRFIDGKLEFSEARVSLFRYFPNISLSLKDASLTYEAEKYDSLEQLDYQAVLLNAGKNTAEAVDTLASFKSFRASLNLPSLLAGELRLSDIELTRPRIFAKYYNDSTYNWNIFRMQGDDGEESAGLPDLVLGRVALLDHPHVVFCSPRDTLFAGLDIRKMVVDGKLPLRHPDRVKADLDLDSVKVVGRYASDTLLFALHRMQISKYPRTFNADLSADAFAATHYYGRLRIPVSLKAKAKFPDRDLRNIEIENFDAELAYIPLHASGQIVINKEDIEIKAQAETDAFKISTLLEEYGPNFWDGAVDVATDAKLSLLLLSEGKYDLKTGALPELAAEIWIPEAKINYAPLGVHAGVEMRLDLQNSTEGELYAELKKLNLKGHGLDVNVIGTGDDVLGDGRFKLKGKLNAVLESLLQVLPEDSGVRASGTLDATFSGNIRSSQLNKDNIARADLLAGISTDSLSASIMNDSLRLGLGKTFIKLNTLGSRLDSTVARGQRLVALETTIGTLSAGYKDSLDVKARNIALNAQSSADIMDSSKKLGFYPFDGRFTADLISLMDVDSARFVVRKTEDSFKIASKKGQPEIPELYLSSSNAGFFLKDKINRLGLRGVRFKAKAVKNSSERRPRRNIPRPGQTFVPDNESDFAQMDISLDFGETINRYYRTWNVNGDLAMDKVRLITPYFPIETSLHDFKGDFTNDGVNVHNMKLVSGESELTAQGSLSNLKRAVARRGKMKLELNLESDHINMDELLGAYAVGSRFKEEEYNSSIASLSDEEYSSMIVQDSLDKVSLDNQLIVIPGNVEANLKLDAHDIDFSKLSIGWMASDMMVRNRCLQLTNTVATSNMGDIYFEGFYSTKSRKDLSAGFFVNFVDITAEKVIELMPSVDTLVPLLKAFKGLLDCEMAATARIDSCMNIIMPSVNGVVTVSGKDMEFIQTDEFTKIARTLMFKSKKGAFIENMSVQALVSDNVMEVFPFALEMDRYKLAMSGEQQLDLPYRYHVSVLKSPIPFRLGIDIFGPDFDHMKFKIGKAKYKSTNVPAFTTVINQAKMSLTSAIHNIFNVGADEVLKANGEHKAIKEWKKAHNYVAAVDMKMDTLSVKEKSNLDSLRVSQDSIQLIKIENIK